MDPVYITAKEAMKILDLPSTTFYREVEAGNIPYIIDQGRKRGMRFPKEAMELHAQMRKKSKRKAVHHAFMPATNADIWVAIENGRKIYGDEDTVSYRKALEWREINDEMTMCIKEDGRFVGCTTFIPLDERAIHDVIYDRIRERNIPNSAIRRWTEPKLSVYIASITIHSSDDLNLDRERGVFLLRHALKWAVTLSHQYDIKNWYGIGTTPIGQRILEQLQFQEIVSLAGGKRKGYLLDNPGRAHILQRFSEGIDHQDLLLSEQKSQFVQVTAADIIFEYRKEGRGCLTPGATTSTPVTTRRFILRIPFWRNQIHDLDILVSY